MANHQPFTWKPSDVVEVTNVGAENLLLELPAGLLRLDAGRTLRLTARALDQPQVKQLVNAGKINVKPFRWSRRSSK